MLRTGSSRYAVFAGLVTTVTGGALAVAPERFGPMMGLTEPSATRMIGMADLALVPGLILSRSQGAWLAARVVVNLVIVSHLLTLASHTRSTRLPRMVSAGLAAASIGDLRAIAALQGAHPTSSTQRGTT
jgi:hypothetical protein